MTLVRLQDAQILHVNSPSDFSVRLAAFDRKFFLLKERLNEFYSGNRLNLKLGPEIARSVKPGELATVLHDSCWSRALILATNHQSLITVWLLDYGTTHDFTVGALYSLDDGFLEENAFAVRCHLPHLLEDIGSPWHTAATVQMKAMLDKYGPDVQIEGLQADDTPTHGGVCKSLPVNLMWSFEESSPFGPLVKKTVSLLAKLNSMQFSYEHFEEHMNLSEEVEHQLADSLTEAIDLVSTSDDETETKNSLPQNEQTKSNFRWPDPQIPFQESFLARCTHVDDSGQFYLQMEDTKSRIKSMNDELTSRYMGAKRSSNRVKERSECIARWSDGKWYRGRVISYGPFEGRSAMSEAALVLFVDFGHSTMTKTKNIRSNLSFQKIPIQAVRVILNDVKPRNGGQWSVECLDFMYQKTNSVRNVNQSPVRVAVMENNQKMPLQVKIYVHSKNGIWVDLSDLLVEIGGAVYEHSFVRTLEMEKRWGKESHGVGYVPPLSYRSNLDLAPEEMVEVSLPMDFPFRIPPDPLRFAKAGDTVNVKLASILSCNRINVHPVVDDTVCGNVCSANSKLHTLGSQYEEMMKKLQENALGMPPVIRPTRGLPVAAKFKVKGSHEKLWYRGIIHHVVDRKISVIFVDFDRVLFTVESNELVELPSFCGDVPVIGMEMKLGVVATDDEEEVATLVMGECLWRREGVLTAKFISTGTSPRVVHIIDPATGKPVYSSLRDDGFIIFYPCFDRRGRAATQTNKQ